MKKVKLIVATACLVVASTLNTQVLASEVGNGIESKNLKSDEVRSCTVTATISVGYGSTYGSIKCTAVAENCDEANRMIRNCVTEGKKTLEGL
jgi:hypothetical protein